MSWSNGVPRPKRNTRVMDRLVPVTEFGPIPAGWKSVWLEAAQMRVQVDHRPEIREAIGLALDQADQYGSLFWVIHSGQDPHFCFVFHRASGEIGFWIPQAERSRGRAALCLSRALASLPAGPPKLVMARVAQSNLPALAVCHRVGLRVLSDGAGHRIFALDRP